jgi:hypothetical protein
MAKAKIVVKGKDRAAGTGRAVSKAMDKGLDKDARNGMGKGMGNAGAEMAEPASVWVGRRVLTQFQDRRWYAGKVLKASTESSQGSQIRVRYDDGDEVWLPWPCGKSTKPAGEASFGALWPSLVAKGWAVRKGDRFADWHYLRPLSEAGGAGEGKGSGGRSASNVVATAESKRKGQSSAGKRNRLGGEANRRDLFRECSFCDRLLLDGWSQATVLRRRDKVRSYLYSAAASRS